MRIQIEMPEQRVRDLETLMKEVGIQTKKELINNALTLFEWSVRQRKLSRVIGSLNREENSFREVLLPVFANIQATVQNQTGSDFDEFIEAGITMAAEIENKSEEHTKQGLIDVIKEIPTEDLFQRISKRNRVGRSKVPRELLDTNSQLI